MRGPTDFRVTRPEASVPVSSESATPIRTSPTSRAMTRTLGQYSVRLRCLDTPGGALQSSDATPGGSTLSEPKYRILHQLGAGGMGTVRKGLLLGQAGFQRPIVVKQLKTPEPEHLRLFVEEARRYAVLDHENIGRIFDFERVDGELCIVLEYIDGWSLVEYLERHRGLGCLPDVELSVFIASRVCRGLQYVFEKARIVHRDVSPSNVMMTTEGTVKLIDFGIAARSGTRESYLAGKPSYMAPEMVVEMRADQRSDIFSLGAVLFEILTGERLFTGDTHGGGAGEGRGRRHPEGGLDQPGGAGGGRGDPRPRPRAPARPPLRLGRGHGRGLRALPLRQGLRADQPHPEALPRVDLRARHRTNESAADARSHEPTLIPLRDEMRRTRGRRARRGSSPRSRR